MCGEKLNLQNGNTFPNYDYKSIISHTGVFKNMVRLQCTINIKSLCYEEKLFFFHHLEWFILWFLENILILFIFYSELSKLYYNW